MRFHKLAQTDGRDALDAGKKPWVTPRLNRIEATASLIRELENKDPAFAAIVRKATSQVT